MRRKEAIRSGLQVPKIIIALHPSIGIRKYAFRA
jgi:hypothetical protein